ncbi:MAG: YbbR-like domain-containing protein [Muribaculaceae bacterium]|nr:YbbR-like domain-containing protein [Muribaculaceae bacterium]
MKSARLRKVRNILRSERGRNALMFILFIFVAALLWAVMSFNQPTQVETRMPVVVTNVPDSVTLITAPPRVINVSMVLRGTPLMKILWGSVPTLEIDYRVFKDGSALRLGDADIKGLVRDRINSATVQLVTPDSLVLFYTTSPGHMLPVKLNANISTSAQVAQIGAPSLSSDSVRVFSAGRLPASFSKVSTEEINFTDLTETTTRRVALVAPAGIRVVPDSINVTVHVEPLVKKSRLLPLNIIGAPSGTEIILDPANVEVIYMVPMNRYTDSAPEMSVTADFTRASSGADAKVPLSLGNVPDNIYNVRLAKDSVNFYIQK